MTPTRDTPGDDTLPRRSGADKGLTRVRSRELLGENGRLIIEHGGEAYCLRLTRNDRLILTKQ